MGCAKYGGGICVVGLLISDGIVQEVDLTVVQYTLWAKTGKSHKEK